MPPTDIERGWMVFLFGIAVFCTPLWEWLLRATPWWSAYVCMSLLALGTAWVTRRRD